jgi:small subunit ribosomal protein S14
MKKLNKDLKNRKLFKQYEKQYKILKALSHNELLPLDIRLQIQNEINKQIPKNASKVRQHNFCLETGRARGNLTDFGISRIEMKNKAEFGKLPGVRRSS